MPDLSTFGARLALVRQKMGWGNVAEAARECGLDRESWRLWEQQGREPRRFITVAMAIAARTGVDLDWLVYGPDRARSRVTAGYPSRDPLATRVVRPTGPVRHGDARRRPADRLTAVRFADTPATSTRTRQTAPLPA